MKKYEISIQQTVEYYHKAIIEVPDGKDLDIILDKTENNTECFDDALYRLEQQGCKIIEKCEDNDGQYSEIEIDDYNEVKEG